MPNAANATTTFPPFTRTITVTTLVASALATATQTASALATATQTASALATTT